MNSNLHAELEAQIERNEIRETYLAALARLRREMLIGEIEIGPCECGKMTANQHGGTYCCDECAEIGE